MKKYKIIYQNSKEIHCKEIKQEKSSKISLLGTPGLKILLLAVLFITLFLPMVSAWSLNPFADKVYQETDKLNLDNAYLKEDFNSKYGVIQISNTFLWIETDRIVEYSLVDNTEQCWIDCEAKGKATLYKDGKLFEGKEFIGIEKLENSQYWIGIEEKKIDDYERVCPKDVSPTNTCYDVLSGSHFETVWEKYNYEDLKAGDYKWKLTGTKEGSANIDFQLVSNGKTLSQWAWWNGTGGTVTIDGAYTVHTFTTNGTFNWTGVTAEISILLVAGGGGGGKAYGHTCGGGGAGGYIYNTSYNISSGNYNVVVGSGGLGATTNDASGGRGTNSSFSVDSYFQANGGGGGLGFSGSATGDGGSGGGDNSEGDANEGGKATPSWQGNNGGHTTCGTGGCGGGGMGGVGASTGGKGGAGVSNSIKGTAVVYSTGGSYAAGTSTPANRGWGGNATANGSSGVVIIRYLTAVNSAPTVVLNSPIESDILTTLTVEFNCTGSDDADTTLDNVSLILNGEYEVTNSSVSNGTVVINTVDLIEGNYNWTCEACDTMGLCANATTGNFSILLGTPVPYLTSPINHFNTTLQVDDFEFNFTLLGGLDWLNYTFDVWDSGNNLIKNREVFNGTPDADCSQTPSGNSVLGECIGQSITGDDEYKWNIYVCGDSNKCAWAGTNYTFEIHTVAPQISIISPTATNYTNNATQLLNISVTEEHPNVTLYNWNGTNYTYTTPINVTFGQGSHTVIVYANDTFGNANQTSVTFFIDSVAPTIVYDTPPTPVNNSNLTVPYFEVSAYQDGCTTYEYVNVTLYVYNNSGVVQQYSGNGSCYYDGIVHNQKVTKNFTGLADGTYRYNATAVDEYGNSNVTTVQYVNIDATLPVLNITYPIGTINYHANNTNLTLNWTVSDTNLDKCWVEYFNSDDYNRGGFASSNTHYKIGTGFTHANITKNVLGGSQNLGVYNLINNCSVNGKIILKWNTTAVYCIGNGTNYTITSTDAHLGISTDFYDKVNCSTGTENITIRNYNQSSITMYANDTFGLLTSDTQTWNYRLFQSAVSYPAETIGGSMESFSISLLSQSNTLSVVYLVHNGTTYLLPGIGGVYSGSIAMPTFPTAQNVTFYFYVILNDSSTTNISYVHLIEPFSVDDCSVGTKNLYNISIVDEETLANISGTVKMKIDFYPADRSSLINTYNGSFVYNGTDPIQVCLANITGTYSVDYIMQFYSNESLYFIKYKMAQNSTITNTTLEQNITLYDLLYTSGNIFQVFVRGVPGGNAGILVDVQKQYLPTANFISTESYVTDSGGEAVAHLTQASAIYNFLISKNGRLIGTFNNYQVKCVNYATGDCSVRLDLTQATATTPSFTTTGNITGVYLLDEATRTLYFTYTAVDSQTHTVTQEVKSNDGFGNNTIYNGTSFGLSGTITGLIPVSLGNVTFYSLISVDGQYAGTKMFSIGGEAPDWQGVDVLIELLLYSSVALLFTANPITIVLGAMVGFGLSFLLILLNGGNMITIISILGWFIVAGSIVIWRISKVYGSGGGG